VIFLDTSFLYPLFSEEDRTSFVLMERLGIREALALDSDFTHRFIARSGPRSR
jgi:predicted nucleic acid-binding protein